MQEPDNVEFENLLAGVRSLAADEALRVTQGAQQEMVEEASTLDEVLQAIRNGEVLEDYPEHRRGLAAGLTGSRMKTARSTSFALPASRCSS